MMNNPHDRREVIKRAVENAGGKLHALYFSLGEFDVLTIQEWPDAESAAAFAVAVGSSDAVTRTMTTQLFTSEQGMNVMGAATRLNTILQNSHCGREATRHTSRSPIFLLM